MFKKIVALILTACLTLSLSITSIYASSVSSSTDQAALMLPDTTHQGGAYTGTFTCAPQNGTTLNMGLSQVWGNT